MWGPHVLTIYVILDLPHRRHPRPVRPVARCPWRGGIICRLLLFCPSPPLPPQSSSQSMPSTNEIAIAVGIIAILAIVAYLAGNSE